MGMSTEKPDRWISHTLFKLYGLVSVAGFAVILAAVNADQTVKTASFTVLGTIAGFLAGKPDPPSSPETANPDSKCAKLAPNDEWADA
jgi:hypothetical protein